MNSNWRTSNYKVIAFDKTFPTLCCMLLLDLIWFFWSWVHCFPSFSGWESSCRFDFWPFFYPYLLMHIFKWKIWVHFQYLNFESFPIVERTLDLDKIYPYNFVQKFKTFCDSQLPKWAFLLKVLKMLPFHSPNVLMHFSCFRLLAIHFLFVFPQLWLWAQSYDCDNPSTYHLAPTYTHHPSVLIGIPTFKSHQGHDATTYWWRYCNMHEVNILLNLLLTLYETTFVQKLHEMDH